MKVEKVISWSIKVLLLSLAYALLFYLHRMHG